MSHAPEPTRVHHAIDYIELTVTDVAEARRFYGAAFGWAFNGRRVHFTDPSGSELAAWSES